MKILIAIVLLLIGAVWCLFGYRLFRPISALLGFAACGTSGYCIADYYGLNTVYVLLIAAAAGLIGGALGFWLVKVHAFLAGLLCGALAVISVLALVTGNTFMGGIAIAEEHPVLYIVIAVLAGLLCAVLCVVFFKPAILLLSAASGALLLTSQINTFLSLEDKVTYIILGVAALIGILVQIITTGGLIHDKKDRKKKEEVPENDETSADASQDATAGSPADGSNAESGNSYTGSDADHPVDSPVSESPMNSDNSEPSEESGDTAN